MDKFKEMPEIHMNGDITLENKEIFKNNILISGDLGLQIDTFGKVWICINGIAFLRFKPFRQDNHE